MARTTENVGDELNRWKQQRAVVQDQLDHLDVLEKSGNVPPRDRVELAIKRGQLGAELTVIEQQIEPLQAELAELEKQQQADLVALGELNQRGQKAWAKFLKALDALESEVHACLALQREAHGLGVQGWPGVPNPLVLALAQTRQIIKFRESMDRQRLEGLERKAKQAKEQEKEPDKKKRSAAGKLWDDLKSQMDGEK